MSVRERSRKTSGNSYDGEQENLWHFILGDAYPTDWE